MTISSIVKYLLLSCCIASPSYAASVSFADIPEELKLEMKNNPQDNYYLDDRDLSGASKLSLSEQNVANYSSDVTTPILTAFNLLHETAQGVVEQTKLLRYSLYSPSAFQKQNGGYYDSTGNYIIINSVNQLSGYFWMEVPSAISWNGDNIINLFDQKVTYGDISYYRRHSFNLSPSAMINGVGVLKASDRDNGGNPTVFTGDMSMEGNTYTNYCIECLYDITLNLVGFNYNNGEFAVSQKDSRSLLFSGNSYFNGQDQHRDLFVQPSEVPLPASLWFFASGIFLLGLCTKRVATVASST